MMVCVMVEATCEVAVVCYEAASIHVNAQGLCTCLQVLFIIYHVLLLQASLYICIYVRSYGLHYN